MIDQTKHGPVPSMKPILLLAVGLQNRSATLAQTAC